MLDLTVLHWQSDTRDDLEELLLAFEIRRLNKPEAAALAAARNTGATRAAIGTGLDAVELSSETPINLIAADEDFHLSVLNAARKKYRLALGTGIEMVIKLTARFSRLRPGGLQHALPMHRTVCYSILSRRSKLARADMRALSDEAQEDMRMVPERRAAIGPNLRAANDLKRRPGADWDNWKRNLGDNNEDHRPDQLSGCPAMAVFEN